MITTSNGAFRAAWILASLTHLTAAHAASGGTDYNVLVFQNFNGQHSDVEGALAAGGDITLMQGYSVAQQLGSSSDGKDTLVAGGMVTFGNGTLFHGNSAAQSYGASGFTITTGSKNFGSPLDFAGLKTTFTAYSNAMANDVSNGSSATSYGTLSLTGSAADLNVFDLDGSSLGALNGLNLSVPANAFALINVSGLTSSSFQNFQFNVNGLDASHILFNFSDATSITLGGIGFVGSILAPHAQVTFDNGHIDGQIIANAFTGSGQVNLHIADDTFYSATATPEASTWLMLITGVAAIGATLRRRRRANSSPGLLAA